LGCFWGRLSFYGKAAFQLPIVLLRNINQSIDLCNDTCSWYKAWRIGFGTRYNVKKSKMGSWQSEWRASRLLTSGCLRGSTFWPFWRTSCVQTNSTAALWIKMLPLRFCSGLHYCSCRCSVLIEVSLQAHAIAYAAYPV
jgi:hypothetical protein